MDKSDEKKEIPNPTLDRARAVDAKFIARVRNADFPKARTNTTPQQAGLSKTDCLEIFQSQMISRHLDLMARILRERNQSFYTIGSSGHEGNAAIARAFRVTDMAFLHYRSNAFMLERARLAGIQTETAIKDHLLALVASKDDPIAGGRHKVFGSLPLNVPPQTSTIASHLPKALGTAFSIHLAKELNLKSKLPYDALILCSFGDASVNHSTAQGAFNAAAWVANQKVPLPLIFICEDNGIGISVPTPSDWIEKNFKHRTNIEYLTCDGLNFCDVFMQAEQAASQAREKRQPIFLHFKTVRLLGHAGSDIESHYHSLQEIEAIEAEDPLLHSARILIENQFATQESILKDYESIRQEVASIAEIAIKAPKLTEAKEIIDSIIPSKGVTINHSEANKINKSMDEAAPKHMAVLLNQVLAETLQKFPNTFIFGEDVGKKGGVYRVTAGLQQKFGKRRVFDTLLDEQTILGTALGMAHNGLLPIPEIQFLAFIHNAEDQIRGEAATLSFFSKGQFTNPMLLRLPGLAYQKGFGGHFHNDNAFAFLREIPGLIIACPSNAVDAVKLFRRCLQLVREEQRVVIFLEPIALYMMKDLHEKNDGAWLGLYPKEEETLIFGELGVYRQGRGQDILIISYGNGYYLSRQAEKKLREEHQIQATIVDLRWLLPLNLPAILELARGFKKILIVDEGRKTGSLSEELMTAFVENSKPLPLIRRLTGQDSFIPLGDAWQVLLPSTEEIVKMAYNMVSQEK